MSDVFISDEIAKFISIDVIDRDDMVERYIQKNESSHPYSFDEVLRLIKWMRDELKNVFDNENNIDKIVRIKASDNFRVNNEVIAFYEHNGYNSEFIESRYMNFIEVSW